jgi:hypothetical protein
VAYQEFAFHLRPPRELPRLFCPRWLAERSERPLEYPENASELAPLRCRVLWVSPLNPRDSWLAPEVRASDALL